MGRSRWPCHTRRRALRFLETRSRRVREFSAGALCPLPGAHWAVLPRMPGRAGTGLYLVHLVLVGLLYPYRLRSHCSHKRQATSLIGYSVRASPRCRSQPFGSSKGSSHFAEPEVPGSAFAVGVSVCRWRCPFRLQTSLFTPLIHFSLFT